MRLAVLLPEATVNYIQNPQVHYDTTGWNAQGATIAKVLTQSRFGASSLRVVTSGAALREGTFYRVSELAGVNEVITVSAYVRGEGVVRIRLDNNVVGGTEFACQPTQLTLERWQRLSVTGFSTGGNDLRLYVETDEGTAKVRTFYVDGAQLERKAYPTTYCDGDREGCHWNGAAHASSSDRNGHTRSGGRWYALAGEEREQDDLYMTFAGGLGAAPVENRLESFDLEPGAFFMGSKVLPRLITLTFHAKHKVDEVDEPVSLARLHALRQTLIDALKPDRTEGSEAVCFEYDNGARPLYFWARYDGGLEGDWDIRNQFVNSFPLRLLAVSPDLTEDSQETQVLDFQESSQGFRRVAHRKAGVWDIMNYGMNTSVGDLELGPRGQVVAGGAFTVVNNGIQALNPFVTSSRVSYFDGTQWVRLSGSSNGAVNDVAIASNGDIYVTGAFTNFDGVAANRIARWDGSTWNALGSGLDNDGVHISIDCNNRVYVGGKFSTAGGVAAARVAYWDGNAWHGMGQYSGLDGDVNSIAVSPDGTRVYLGGSFVQQNGLTDAALLRVTLYDLETDRFSAVGNGFDDIVREVVLDAGGVLYACGDFTTSGTTTVNRIGKFVGGAWHALGNGMNNTVYSFDIGTNGDIIAVGAFTEAGGVTVQNMAIWNGSTWANTDLELALGDSSRVLLAVQYAPNGDVYLGGFWGGAVTTLYAAINLVDNPGTAETHPLVRIGGPGRLRWLENQTNGKRIFLDLTLIDGEEVFLDFQHGRAESSVRGSVLSSILPGSDFAAFTLLPGVNRLSCFMMNDVDAELQIMYTPTYWGADVAPEALV